jgi:hypothetical protein
MADIKRLPLVAHDSQPWEMQPYDTPKAYESFFLYYFPQATPRSVTGAYRNANPQMQPGKTDKRQAPSNWRRWALGKDTKGNRKYYRLIEPSGGVKVLPIPTWDERATSWDDTIRQSLLDKKLKADEELLDDMQSTLKGAWGRLIQAWHQYSPTGNERIGELAQASMTLSRTIELVYFGKMSGEDEDGTGDGVDTGMPELTDMDRVEAIGELVARAQARKRDTEPPEPGLNGPPPGKVLK